MKCTEARYLEKPTSSWDSEIVAASVFPASTDDVIVGSRVRSL